MKYKSVDAAIEAVIAIEKAEVGYIEKASNANLDSKTANPGKNNFTKYWRDLSDMKLIGTRGFAGGSIWHWCAAFQTWSFIKAFGVELTKKLFYHMPYISCNNLGIFGRKYGQLHTNPKKGDIVLYWNGSRFFHTGFVYNVDAVNFYTTEGNTDTSRSVVPNGGGVCNKAFNIKRYQAYGVRFFRPNYSIVVGNGESSNAPKTNGTIYPDKKEAPKKSDAEYKTVKTNGDNLNCRSLASTNGAILGKFANGTKLTILGKSGNWYKVSGTGVDNKKLTGFVSKDWVK